MIAFESMMSGSYFWCRLQIWSDSNPNFSIDYKKRLYSLPKRLEFKPLTWGQATDWLTKNLLFVAGPIHRHKPIMLGMALETRHHRSLLTLLIPVLSASFIFTCSYGYILGLHPLGTVPSLSRTPNGYLFFFFLVFINWVFREIHIRAIPICPIVMFFYDFL